ncbi:hypothetical protein PIB30_067013 [Stylosanthes scabra]|uniref:Uncharacterized protein n=1 Tax=Stylosanthes scabra TaxID=79078 RepID=A0ABU6WMG0_9FABA|nr:hypothetical protein [Stylosanthes scabra]
MGRLQTLRKPHPLKSPMKSHHYPLHVSKKRTNRFSQRKQLRKTRSNRNKRKQKATATQAIGRFKENHPEGIRKITSEARPKRNSSSQVGAMLRTGPEAQFSRNKAMNEWPTRKEESSKIGKIRYNPNRSHDDLNHLKLYKQGVSSPQGTHSLTLLTIFDLEPRNPISGFLGLFISTLISFSVIVLGYAEELVIEGTPSHLEHCSLVPHSKFFG